MTCCQTNAIKQIVLEELTVYGVSDFHAGEYEDDSALGYCTV
jgi:hypothetical protein